MRDSLDGPNSSMSSFVEKSSTLPILLMDNFYVAWQCLAEVKGQVLGCAIDKKMHRGTEEMKAAFLGRGILKINHVQENSICVRECMV